MHDGSVVRVIDMSTAVMISTIGSINVRFRGVGNRLSGPPLPEDDEIWATSTCDTEKQTNANN